MNKFSTKAITICCIVLFFNTMVSKGQDGPKYSLKVGKGYFGNVWYKQIGPEGEFEGYNPKKYDVHDGDGLFFELSYKFNNGYSLGAKLLKAETHEPYNNIGLTSLLYDNYSIATYNSYEIFFNYDFKLSRSHIILGVGPVMCKLQESYYDGIINEIQTDQWGYNYGLLKLNSPIIEERQFWDMGINPKIDYEYMINNNIGVGIKAEAYLLAYLGLSYVFVSPTLVFKY